jgi:hypothetical protein
MKTHAFLPFPRTAGGFLQARTSYSETTARGEGAQRWHLGFALGLAALLLPLAGASAFAQQTPGDPNYQQDAPPPPPADPGYPQQVAPAPQQAYPSQQPGYAQDPNYAQQDADQAPPAPDMEQGYPQQGSAQAQALAPDQLDQLVAPIALYPDALVAQVLAASTYPEQVVDASRWRQAQGDASPDQIAAAANAQPWDPSVKGLTAFPQVLQHMVQNLSWTTELGNAYYNQPQDVMNALQSMRERAEAAGTLRSTPQETVNDDQGAIQLAPANPEVVYVPEYNPWAVYGQPVAPYPGYSVWGGVGSYLGSAALQYGMGIAVGAFLHMPWGWPMWGVGWLGQGLMFHGGGWYSHSRTVADWGFPHGGPRANGWRGGYGDRGFGDRGLGNRGFGGDRAYSGRPAENFGNRGGYLGNSGFHEYGAGPARLAAERGAEGYRGNEGFRGNDGRPTQQAYNRGSEFNSRGYGRADTGYGAGINDHGAGAYGRAYGGGAYGGSGAFGRNSGFYGQNTGRPQIARNEGMGLREPQGMNGYRGQQPSFRAPEQGYRGESQSYRQPAQNYRGFSQPYRGGDFGRGGFGGQSSRGFGGYLQRAPQSFGGGHAFSGGGHAFSGGGGRFGGGGHVGGGGGHFGGGHSGGGHLGGGHRR